jgi:hypothetical protein
MDRGSDPIGGGQVLTVELLVAENRAVRDEQDRLAWELEQARQRVASLELVNDALKSENELLRSVTQRPDAHTPDTSGSSDLRSDLDLLQRKFLEVTEMLVHWTQKNDALKARILELEEELLKAQRASKRQAAPFRRKNRIPKSQQKKSGRPKGHPPAYRRPPTEVDETVHVPLQCTCPDCDVDLVDHQEHEHFTVDIPPVRPKTTRFVTSSGRCPRCRKRFQSSHPDLPSSAVGAAGVTLGPNVVALAGLMRAYLGVPLRKIASFLAQVFGLPVSAAGIFGALGRLSRALEPTYQGLQLDLRQRAVVHSDETGWRLCCESAWLWVFTCPDITIYVIRASRGHKVVVEVLGERFFGWLVTDFLATYNPLDYPHKAKCIPHLLRALSEVETLLGEQPEAGFAQEAKSIFKMAIALRQGQDRLSEEVYQGIRAVVRYKLDQLLLQDITDPHSLRLAKRIAGFPRGPRSTWSC